MKTGKTIRNVILLILSVLIISSVLLYLYVSNNTADAVMSFIEWKKADDSPWINSFDEIDTSLRGSTTVKGFSLYYNSLFLLRLDSLVLDKGVKGIYDFWKKEGDEINITLDGGSVNLTAALDAYRDYRTKERKDGFSFYSFISRRNVVLASKNIGIEYDSLSFNSDNLDFTYRAESSVLSGSLVTEEISLNEENYNGTIERASCSFVRDDGITVNFNADCLHMSSEKADISISGLTLTEKTPSLTAFISDDSEGEIYFDSAQYSQGDNSTEAGNAFFEYEEGKLSGRVFDVYLSSPLFDAESEEVNFTGDFDLNSDAYDDGFILTSDTVNLSFSSFIEKKFSSALLTDFVLENNGEGEEEITLSAVCSLDDGDENKDDITFEFSSVFNSSSLSRAEMTSFYPGFGSALSSPVLIEENDESYEITLSDDNVVFDFVVHPSERRVTGNLDLDDYPLKSALEYILEKNIEKIGENSAVDMTSSLDIILTEDGRPEGSADFSISITSYRISFFSLVVSIEGSVVFEDGKMNLDGVRFISPLFSFSVEGYYDFVTGKPHFSFSK